MKIKEPKSLDLGSLHLSTPESVKVMSFLLPQEDAISMQKEIYYTISTIRIGIPKSAVQTVLESTHISLDVFSNLLHISARQLKRYADTDRLPPEQSGFLYEFARLYLRAKDIFGDEDTVNDWIKRPNTALAEQSPIDLLDTAEGYRIINNLLSQIEYGYYS